FFFSSRRRHTRWPRDWSSDVCSSDLHSCEQWINFRQKLLGWQASKLGVPEPFVSHSADAALYLFRIRNATERGRHHVTVFERGNELGPFGGIVAKPVQQF